MRLLHRDDSENGGIAVYDTDELVGRKGRFRVLEFGSRAMQGALDLDNPERMVFEYPQAILHLMEHHDPLFENIFIIGHGIGTIAAHCAGKRVRTAELDRRVVEISRDYFGQNTEHVIIGDGRAVLEGEPPHSYNYIVVDAFNERGTPLHLMSGEFFRLTRRKLLPGGAVMMNLVGRRSHDKLIAAVYTTLRREYPHTLALILPDKGRPDLHNIVIAGSDKPLGYQARKLAGFIPLDPGHGYIIEDGNGY